jgi:hypothetical protein
MRAGEGEKRRRGEGEKRRRGDERKTHRIYRVRLFASFCGYAARDAEKLRFSGRVIKRFSRLRLRKMCIYPALRDVPAAGICASLNFL